MGVMVNYESEQMKIPNSWMQLYSLIVILWHLYAQEACWQPGQLAVIAGVDLLVKYACRSVTCLSKTMGLCSYLSMMFIPCNVSTGMHSHTVYAISHSWVWKLYGFLRLCQRIVHAFCEEIYSCLVNSRQLHNSL